MSKGLFKSVYGKTNEGIFPDLYSREGSTPTTKRVDIRLGNYSFGQVEDEDEDEEETPDSTSSEKLELPEAPGGKVEGPSVFAKDKEGFPMWLVGIFMLGFAIAWRQKKKSASA